MNRLKNKVKFLGSFIVDPQEDFKRTFLLNRKNINGKTLEEAYDVIQNSPITYIIRNELLEGISFPKISNLSERTKIMESNVLPDIEDAEYSSSESESEESSDDDLDETFSKVSNDEDNEEKFDVDISEIRGMKSSKQCMVNKESVKKSKVMKEKFLPIYLILPISYSIDASALHSYIYALNPIPYSDYAVFAMNPILPDYLNSLRHLISRGYLFGTNEQIELVYKKMKETFAFVFYSEEQISKIAGNTKKYSPISCQIQYSNITSVFLYSIEYNINYQFIMNSLIQYIGKCLTEAGIMYFYKPSNNSLLFNVLSNESKKSVREMCEDSLKAFIKFLKDIPKNPDSITVREPELTLGGPLMPDVNENYKKNFSVMQKILYALIYGYGSFEMTFARGNV